MNGGSPTHARIYPLSHCLYCPLYPPYSPQSPPPVSCFPSPVSRLPFPVCVIVIETGQGHPCALQHCAECQYGDQGQNTRRPLAHVSTLLCTARTSFSCARPHWCSAGEMESLRLERVGRDRGREGGLP